MLLTKKKSKILCSDTQWFGAYRLIRNMTTEIEEFGDSVQIFELSIFLRLFYGFFQGSRILYKSWVFFRTLDYKNKKSKYFQK